MSTGLTLKKLILQNTGDNKDILKNALTFLEYDSASKIQKVLVPAADGGNDGIRNDHSEEKLVYVEYKTYELPARRPNDQITVERACKLARLLQHTNASEAGFHTLRLRCLVQQKRQSGTCFAVVFDLPDGVDPTPTTLLQAIKTDSTMRPTLGQRFRIAHSLAQTLFQFHSVGWLHKSIRSENVLLFPSPKENRQIDYCHPYLVGFEFSRDVLDRSNTEQDGVLEHNIYRHPDRQGSPSDEKDPDLPFTIIYDIYSMGVILLEVGLWRAAIGYEDWHPLTPANEIQQSLEAHAKDRLPHYMGQAYTDLVVACLQGSFAGGGRTGLALSDIEREGMLLAYHEAVVTGIENGLSLN